MLKVFPSGPSLKVFFKLTLKLLVKTQGPPLKISSVMRVYEKLEVGVPLKLGKQRRADIEDLAGL